MSIENIDLKKVKEDLAQKMSSVFYHIFTKNLKNSIPIQELDKMKKSCRDLVDPILRAAELKSVDLSIRLAKSTDAGFDKVQFKLDAQEAIIKDLRQDIKNLETRLERELEQRLGDGK